MQFVCRLLSACYFLPSRICGVRRDRRAEAFHANRNTDRASCPAASSSAGVMRLPGLSVRSNCPKGFRDAALVHGEASGFCPFRPSGISPHFVHFARGSEQFATLASSLFTAADVLIPVGSGV